MYTVSQSILYDSTNQERWINWTIRPFISELCRRPVDLDEHDQERGDRRARRQHLGVQRRLQREFLSCRNLPQNTRKSAIDCVELF